MKIAIIDDSILEDWVGTHGMPVAVLSNLVNTLKDSGFTLSLNGRPLKGEGASEHDFAFHSFDADDLESFDPECYDTLLIDWSLAGHSDCGGKDLAREYARRGFPTDRILLVSRHQGMDFVDDSVNGIRVMKKTDDKSIAKWLIQHVNGPTRKTIPSSALCGLLKPNTSLIDKAFHGTLKDEDVRADNNPMKALRDVLDSSIFPEVELLAGQNTEPGIDAIWNRLNHVAHLHTYYPASCMTHDPVWEKIRQLIDRDSVTSSFALRSLRLLDWLFPRPAKGEKPFIDEILKQSCTGCQPYEQTYDPLKNADWISERNRIKAN